MKNFKYIYTLICAIALVTMELAPMGYMVVKPLIVASLLTYYIVSLNTQHSLIILGLVLAIAGDVLLLFESELLFKMGLLAFLGMQLMYVFYLKQFKDKKLSPVQVLLRIIVILILVVFTSCVIYYRVKDGSLLVLYGIALAIMSYVAIGFPRIRKQVSIIGIGAFCFMISDLLLGINRYFISITGSKYLIMILYMAAQYLIIVGITKDAQSYFKALESKQNTKIPSTKK